MQITPTPKLVSLLGLAALAWLTAPAHAQSLQLVNNDNVTVSGAGTDNNGIPSDTKSYSDADGYGYAVQTTGDATFTLEDGGALSSTGNNSIGLDARGSGTVTITGGTITGGQGGYGLSSSGSGSVLVSGGTITGGEGYDGIAALGTGVVTISGGKIVGGAGGNGLSSVGGIVTITGGTINAGPVGAPMGVGLLAAGAGIINLFSLNGTDFFINNVPMNNITLDDTVYLLGTDTIKGTLANGDNLDTTFRDFGGTINLNTPASAAPEPSAVAIWALVGLGGAGLALKAKRRKAAAAR